MNAQNVLPPPPEVAPSPLRFEFHPWKMVLPFTLTIQLMNDEGGEPVGYDITFSFLLFSFVYETA